MSSSIRYLYVSYIKIVYSSDVMSLYICSGVVMYAYIMAHYVLQLFFHCTIFRDSNKESI